MWWITLAGAFGAIAFAALARLGPRETGLAARSAARGATIALTLVAVLALPLSADITAIDNNVTDAGYVGALPAEEQHLLSAYLRAHQDGARYEVAAESATQIGSLIVQDARPVVILTTYDARVFTNVAELQRLIAAGEVQVRLPEHVLRRARLVLLDQRRLLGTRSLGASARDRRIAASRVEPQWNLWLLPGAKQ